jgi:3-methyladenine DNA glycosylase AlkD
VTRAYQVGCSLKRSQGETVARERADRKSSGGRADDKATARAALVELRSLGDDRDAQFLQRFFKTGPGQYGAGDVFVGVRVPVTRKLVKKYQAMSLREVVKLLPRREHEARLLALLLLVERYRRGDEATRAQVFTIYLANTRWINNWDLVDSSAPHIVGTQLRGQRTGRALLTRLAKSRSLWERRIAMIATQEFIRHGELHETFRIARLLLEDKHDLIHKAVGWMLREAGKQDVGALEAFLSRYARVMPRTALRYAIERFSPGDRKRFLAS